MSPTFTPCSQQTHHDLTHTIQAHNLQFWKLPKSKSEYPPVPWATAWLSEPGYPYLIMGHPLGFGYQLCAAHLAVTVCKQLLIDIGGLHQAREKSTGKKGGGGSLLLWWICRKLSICVWKAAGLLMVTTGWVSPNPGVTIPTNHSNE